MDNGQGKSDREASSFDVVQFDSSDDEILLEDDNDCHLMNCKASPDLEVKRNGNTALLQESMAKGPEEDEGDIDSEEERDILKGIRDEIENKVRGEMKDEIEVYKSQLLALEAGKVPRENVENRKEEDDTEPTEMDPKLKEAIVKMQKLDRILNKKLKREREVKRERLILEKRLKEEISEMKHGASNYREIKANTEKFLALAAPPSHNEGVSLDYEEEEEDIPPLFQTQIDDSEIKRKSRNKNMGNDFTEQDGDQPQTKVPNDEAKNRSESAASGQGNKNKSNKKNFIKRNKELAAVASEVIAMTDDEKKRLQDLLGDIDELPEMEESSFDDTESSMSQLALNPGDGFIPDDVESKSLTNIDERLRNIMPEEEFLSISSSVNSQHSTPRPMLFTRVGVKSTANLLDGFGEQVLYETKEERELKARLDSIEKRLEMFKAPNETETDRSDCHLSDEQLDSLLNQCARSMSRMSMSVTNTPDISARSEIRSELSSRQMLMANPPKLSDEQLQELLSQAYFPMSSQLSVLKEDAGDEDTTAISAETWRTIMDQRLEDEFDNDDVDFESSTKAGQNISQNAKSDDGDDQLIQAYQYDNLLLGKEEVTGGSCDSSSALFKSPSRSSSKDFRGFPKISTSSCSSLTGQSSSKTDSIGKDTSLSFKQDVDFQPSSDPLRLPDITSSSFLIHASQGLNNKPLKSQGSASSREPIPMVQNDLSDMSMTSFSEDSWDQSQNNHEKRNSRAVLSPHVPRPPSTSQ